MLHIGVKHKMAERRKIYVFGNCNVKPIISILSGVKDFLKKYEIIALKPVFMCDENDTAEIQEKASGADVLITQPIIGEYYKKIGIDTQTLKSFLPKNAKLIQIPVPYFTGYFPEQFYLHDKYDNPVGECKGLFNPYHNRIIFYGYCNKLSVQEVLDVIYNENNLRNIKEVVLENIEELKRREKHLDVKISKFVKKNYKNKRLFWTINHPSDIILKYVSFEILKILSGWLYAKIEYLLSPSYSTFLSGTKTPIMPSIQKELKLEFECIEKITEDDIKHYYNYYDNNPELVELNRNELENCSKLFVI